jgi:predicted nucleic acid-binding protein
VSAFVDTNVLVRHLTGDPPDMAARATSYLEAETELLVTADGQLRMVRIWQRGPGALARR